MRSSNRLTAGGDRQYQTESDQVENHADFAVAEERSGHTGQRDEACTSKGDYKKLDSRHDRDTHTQVQHEQIVRAESGLQRSVQEHGNQRKDSGYTQESQLLADALQNHVRMVGGNELGRSVAEPLAENTAGGQSPQSFHHLSVDPRVENAALQSQITPGIGAHLCALGETVGHMLESQAMQYVTAEQKHPYNHVEEDGRLINLSFAHAPSYPDYEPQEGEQKLAVEHVSDDKKNDEGNHAIQKDSKVTVPQVPIRPFGSIRQFCAGFDERIHHYESERKNHGRSHIPQHEVAHEQGAHTAQQPCHQLHLLPEWTNRMDGGNVSALAAQIGVAHDTLPLFVEKGRHKEHNQVFGYLTGLEDQSANIQVDGHTTHFSPEYEQGGCKQQRQHEVTGAAHRRQAEELQQEVHRFIEHVKFQPVPVLEESLDIEQLQERH